MMDSANKLHIYELRDPTQDAGMKLFCDAFTKFCNAIAALLHNGGSPYNDPQSEAVCDYRKKSAASLDQVAHFGQLA